MTQTKICSFCGKSHKHVQQLIAGPEVESHKAYICNECIDFSYKIIKQDESQKKQKEAVSYTPSLLKEELDKCILLCANCHREIHHMDS